MKKILCLLITAAFLAGCGHSRDKLGMNTGRDYVSWTNGTVKFSTYRFSDGIGKNVPAFEVFLNYQDGRNIHMPIDALALGYGASSPMGELGFYKPEKLSDAEILLQTDEKLVLHLKYDPWTIYGEQITLDKQITVYRDSPILSVIDYYTGLFELLNIAAGMYTAYTGTVTDIENGYAVEYFNETGQEPFSVSSVIVMPDTEEKTTNETFGTVLLKKGVTSNEALRYYIGISDKGVDYLLDELDKIL